MHQNSSVVFGAKITSFAVYLWQMLEEQIRIATATSKRAELTEREISALPEETKLYAAVGRAFLLQTRGEIMGELTQVKNDAAEKISAKKQQQETVQRKLKESEEALRQLVKAWYCYLHCW